MVPLWTAELFLVSLWLCLMAERITQTFTFITTSSQMETQSQQWSADGWTFVLETNYWWKCLVILVFPSEFRLGNLHSSSWPHAAGKRHSSTGEPMSVRAAGQHHHHHRLRSLPQTHLVSCRTDVDAACSLYISSADMRGCLTTHCPGFNVWNLCCCFSAANPFTPHSNLFYLYFFLQAESQFPFISVFAYVFLSTCLSYLYEDFHLHNPQPHQ